MACLYNPATVHARLKASACRREGNAASRRLLVVVFEVCDRTWRECPAFGTRCTPETPLGATMVPSEGACAAYYGYGRPREAAPA